MNESLSQPIPSTAEVLSSLHDRDSDEALGFRELAIAAKQARQEGDEAAARTILDQLKNDLLISARELNWTDETFMDRLDSYVAIAHSETEAESSLVDPVAITISSSPQAETGLTDVPAYTEGLSDANSGDSEKVRTIDVVSRELAEKRSEFARLSAKRQRKYVDTLDEAYLEKQAEYDALKQEFGRLKLHDELEAITSRSEKELAAISYLFEEQKLLREEMNSNQNMTRRMKVVNKVAELIHSGPRWKRIIKGLGVGALAGLVGGAVGGGIAAAGIIASTRYAKSYTKNRSTGVSDLTRDSAEDLFAPLNYAGSVDTDDDMLKAASQRLNDRLQSDIRAEQKKKRRATYMALGAVAAGSAIGSTIHYGLDIWGGGNVTSAMSSAESSGDTGPGTTGFNPDGSPVGVETQTESPDDDPIESPDTAPNSPDEINQDDALEEETVTGEDTEASQKPEDASTDETSTEKTEPSATGEPGPDAAELEPAESIKVIDISVIPSEALEIKKGEGWLETFRELGIPEDQRARLLEEVGPRLEDIEIAYFDKNIGGYGISKPGDMPVEALQYILETAHEQGIEVPGEYFVEVAAEQAAGPGLPKAGAIGEGVLLEQDPVAAEDTMATAENPAIDSSNELAETQTVETMTGAIDSGAPSYELSYTTTPDGLLKHVAQEQLGMSIPGKEMHETLSYLVKNVGGNNIFQGAQVRASFMDSDRFVISGTETRGLTWRAEQALRELAQSR